MHGRRRVIGDRATAAALVTLALVVALAVLGPLLARLLGLPGPDRIAPDALDAGGIPTGPRGEHPLGVDELGRDVLSRLLHGAARTLGIAVAATAIAVGVGTAVGLLAGYRGGWVDAVLSRLIELFLCFPLLLLAMGLAAACSVGEGCLGGALRPGTGLVIVVMGTAGWALFARVVRGEVLSLREQEFVTAARALGASPWQIAVRELLPNLAPVLLVLVSFALPANILFEAGLSYLGVGVPPPTPTWGTMLAGSLPLIDSAPWYFATPAAAILVTAGALTLVADGLQDALGGRRRLTVRPL